MAALEVGLPLPLSGKTGKAQGSFVAPRQGFFAFSFPHATTGILFCGRRKAKIFWRLSPVPDYGHRQSMVGAIGIYFFRFNKQ